jgi:uncharacterized protein YigE (DUF2233 family)
MLAKAHLVACLLLLVVRSSSAEWIERSSSAEESVSPAIVHRHIEVENGGDVASVDLAVTTRPGEVALRLFDNPGGSYDLAAAMTRNNCTAGVNGGYFDPAFLPMGLRIENGKVVRPLRRARLLTGILAYAPGWLKILRLNEYSPKGKIVTALQCGPLLVDGGRAVPGLEATRSARRTFVIVGPGAFALGTCSDVSLAEAASILSSLRLSDGGKVTRALNLDGGSSTAFWFKRADGSVLSHPEVKTVRDFVAIAPK